MQLDALKSLDTAEGFQENLNLFSRAKLGFLFLI